MIELSASSENAFKLYNFLNKGERKHIKVNGILLDKIKEKYLRFYLNNICGRTSLYFDETMFRNIKPDEQWIIINENDKCLGYIQNILNYNTKYYPSIIFLITILIIYFCLTTMSTIYF